MSDTAISTDLIDDAYRLFLGRKPVNTADIGFDSFDAMISTLFHSTEFKTSPRSRKNTLNWPEAQYFIARDKKVMYCPIGKNACSFFKQAMVKLAEHPNHAVINRSVHMLTDHVKTGIQLSDYGLDDVQTIMDDPDLFKFAILRDPARRLLSAYIEKFVKNREEHGNVKFHTSTVVWAVQAQQGFSEPDFNRGISFRSFVEQITSMPPEVLDPHWRPQYLYLGAYDWPHLYTFDMLPQAIAELEMKSGVQLDAPPVNRSGSGVGAVHPGADTLLPGALDTLPMIAVESYLTPEIDAALRVYYARDYALIDALNTAQ